MPQVPALSDCFVRQGMKGGKAFPLAGTALPTHPLQRGDPATPPERESADEFSVTG